MIIQQSMKIDIAQTTCKRKKGIAISIYLLTLPLLCMSKVHKQLNTQDFGGMSFCHYSKG